MSETSLFEIVEDLESVDLSNFLASIDAVFPERDRVPLFKKKFRRTFQSKIPKGVILDYQTLYSYCRSRYIAERRESLVRQLLGAEIDAHSFYIRNNLIFEGFQCSFQPVEFFDCLSNFYYWNFMIEKRIMAERDLKKQNLGDEDKCIEALRLFYLEMSQLVKTLFELFSVDDVKVFAVKKNSGYKIKLEERDTTLYSLILPDSLAHEKLRRLRPSKINTLDSMFLVDLANEG